jgi:S1-C subfamily serine protease
VYRSTGRRRQAAIAAIALIVLTACGPSPDAVPFADGHTATVEIGDAEAHRTARTITYRVRASGCEALATGSGFALDEHTVITNRHVVEDAVAITLSSWDGRDATVETVAISEDHDLAVIRTVEKLQGWGELGTGSVDDTVWVIGYPKGRQLSVTRGKIVSSVDGDELSGDERTESGQVWQISAKVTTGNSGGPLIGADGTVVGVVYGYGAETQSGYAVKAAAVDGLLSQQPAALDTACGL